MEEISISIEEKTVLNLFNLPFLDTPQLTKEIQKSQISKIFKKTKKVKDNPFGVFVSIHRYLSKLKEYPEDIHGCIGYWDNSFKSLSQEELNENIMKVSRDALLTDDRKTYFPLIETDVLSTVEISYMMNPVYEIDPKTGKILNSKREVFNNNKYGLIVSSNSNSNSNNSRATFLPKVFEEIDWNSIKSKILSKAGISSSSNSSSSSIKYYAYRTKIKTTKIFDIISRNNYPRMLIKNFRDFIEISLKDNSIPYIPYNVNQNGTIICDEKEEIRNLSVLETFMQSYLISNSHFKKSTNSKKSNKMIPRNQIGLNLNLNLNKENLKLDFLDLDEKIQKVINYSLVKIDTLDNQTLANLISAIITYYKVYELLYKEEPKLKGFDILGINIGVDKYINKLLKGIEKAERNFERGQIILALIDYYLFFGKSKKKELQSLIDLTLKLYLYKPTEEQEIKIDDVFRLNWDSQVFTKIFKVLNLNIIQINKKDILGYIFSNLEIYLKLFEKMENQEMEQLETNYLAVSFEGLMNLLSCLKIKEHPQVLSICFKLFLEIMKRYDTKTGLIKFINGDSRIDIMCHFINPLIL
jgi:AMMECR1 domain-containing protein